MVWLNKYNLQWQRKFSFRPRTIDGKPVWLRFYWSRFRPTSKLFDLDELTFLSLIKNEDGPLWEYSLTDPTLGANPSPPQGPPNETLFS